MTGRLTGRVAIVTGAGRGLGRSHALALAAEGAAVVVNDLGGATDGSGRDATPALEVVREIEALGGRAVASPHNVAMWDEAKALVDLADSSFGRLDVLVNNAGILRDRAFANMTESEWDAVVNVHLKGHAATSHHAFAYWRGRHKNATGAVSASVINTTSVSGLFANFGQANYAAAKAGIAAMTQTLAVEGARYGIRVNAVSPSARTRLIADSGINVEVSSEFDDFAPENVSPLVVWLAAPGCSATGQIYQVFGRRIGVCKLARFDDVLASEGRWTLEQLDVELPKRTIPVMTAEEALEGLMRERGPNE